MSLELLIELLNPLDPPLAEGVWQRRTPPPDKNLETKGGSSNTVQ